MDLLIRIGDRLERLKPFVQVDGLRAAIRHIRAAERHLYRAEANADEELLNDVIYRTNQAFEGMLKEAYSMLSGEDSTKKTPHSIEQHLLSKSVLSERVLDLFTNYRKQWRNPSTHDHTLFFDQQEAFLAIVSVTAFAHVLLDQILEHVNYQRERTETASQAAQIKELVAPAKSDSLDEYAARVIQEFAVASPREWSGRRPNTVEAIGQLNGFFASVAKDISVTSHPLLNKATRSRADLLLERNGERVIIEVKSAKHVAKNVAMGIQQVCSYLDAAGLDRGILAFIPLEKEPLSALILDLSSGPSERKLVHLLVPRSDSHLLKQVRKQYLGPPGKS